MVEVVCFRIVDLIDWKEVSLLVNGVSYNEVKIKLISEFVIEVFIVKVWGFELVCYVLDEVM